MKKLRKGIYGDDDEPATTNSNSMANERMSTLQTGIAEHRVKSGDDYQKKDIYMECNEIDSTYTDEEVAFHADRNKTTST